MEKEKFEDFLDTRYWKEINWYDKKANWNHKAYHTFQWIAIVFSALTPILVIIGDGYIRWITVGIAAIVAIVTAALKTFKYQENWINYRTTSETLKKEIHFYKAGIHGYENVDDREAAFVDRVESLISRENTMWVTTHDKEGKPTNQ